MSKDKPAVIEFDLDEVRNDLLAQGYPKKKLDKILKKIQDDPTHANEFTTRAIRKTLNKHEIEEGISKRWE